MAQTCPFCQNPVNAGVFQCPHCGRVQYKIRCSRCGNWSFANSDSCRFCGGAFSPEDQASRYVIEPNDPIMRDIAPTMAPIPRRSVQQQSSLLPLPSHKRRQLLWCSHKPVSRNRADNRLL